MPEQQRAPGTRPFASLLLTGLLGKTLTPFLGASRAFSTAGGIAQSFGSLLSRRRSEKATNEFLTPGSQPGTFEDGFLSYDSDLGILNQIPEEHRDAFIAAINSASGTDPSVFGNVIQANATNEANLGLAGDIRGIAESSGLNDLIAELTGTRGRIEGQFEEDRTRRDERRGGIEAGFADIQGRAQRTGADARSRLEGLADNPNVLSQQEMIEIVGGLLTSSDQTARLSNTGEQNAGGARGLSSGALEALSAIAGVGQSAQQSQQAGQVALTNATLSDQRERFAVSGLSDLAKNLPLVESQIFGQGQGLLTGLDSLDTQSNLAETQALSQLLGLEGDFTGSLDDQERLAAALENQPIDFAGIFNGISSTSMRDLLLTLGQFDAAGALQASIGSGLLNFGLTPEVKQPDSLGFGEQLGLAFLTGGISAIPGLPTSPLTATSQTLGPGQSFP